MELWGILDGLQLACNIGLKKVILETDFKEAVHALQDLESEQNGSTVTRAIKFLLKRNWTVHLRHILREGNKVADGLVKMAFSSSLGRIINIQPSDGILQTLHDDLPNIAYDLDPIGSSFFLFYCIKKII